MYHYVPNLIYIYLTEAVYPPSDFRVVIKGSRATVYWSVIGDLSNIVQFEITYEIVDSPAGTLRITRAIHGYKRSLLLSGLVPSQTYRFFMVTIGRESVSNSSEVQEFITSTQGKYINVAICR